MINKEFADISSGEILTGQQILKEVLQGKQEAHKRKLEGLDKRKSKEAFNFTVDRYLGSFNFSHYKEVLELMKTDKGVFDGALAFRFIYLSTFMDFDNNLRFGLKFRNKYREYMTERDLGEVLRLSRNHVTKFKQKMIKLNILSIDKKSGIMHINSSFCHKGKLKNSLKGESVRVFEKGIQEIYQNSLPKEHKRLGIMIQLLPYLNVQHNVLCWNPEESEPKSINPLTIQDVCRIIGYEVKNARRLENELLQTTVGEKCMLMKHMKYHSMIYSINPKLFYKGNNIEDLRALINLFEIG